MKKILGFLLVGTISGVVALGVYHYFINPFNLRGVHGANQERSIAFASLRDLNKEGHTDFVAAAELSTPSVVHIKTIVETVQNSQRNPSQGAPFDFFDFFGENGFGFEMPPRGPRGGSGSGVILTSDGYIATNNHVIEGASKIEVTLNDRRTFIAELVGADPTTDLALLKIEDRDLPYLPVGNSDSLKVGQWVIAVGNPMNLNSTVTAGIVSAKGRSINILRSQDNKYAIENFIQTDAAINPGNSGGALVNPYGELIGINTAIASQNGGFIGYGFAIPINLAIKVLDDLKKFGTVQRGLLGVSIQDIDADFAEKQNIKTLEGVYVQDVMPNSAAEKGGVQKGDVILSINSKKVKSSSELQEEVGRYRPGDKMKIGLERNKKTLELNVVLLNKDGKASTEIAEIKKSKNSILGLVIEPLSAQEKSQLKLKMGVKIIKVEKGSIFTNKIQSGFILTHIDKSPIYSVNNAINILENKKGGILIEGKNKEGATEVIGVLIE